MVGPLKSTVKNSSKVICLIYIFNLISINPEHLHLCDYFFFRNNETFTFFLDLFEDHTLAYRQHTSALHN